MASQAGIPQAKLSLSPRVLAWDGESSPVGFLPVTLLLESNSPRARKKGETDSHPGHRNKVKSASL